MGIEGRMGKVLGLVKWTGQGWSRVKYLRPGQGSRYVVKGERVGGSHGEREERAKYWVGDTKDWSNYGVHYVSVGILLGAVVWSY